MVVRTALIVASLSLLLACGGPPSCAEQAGPFLDQMRQVAREWDDASKLAGQTPRASLSGQIASLQAIKRKAEDVDAPACAASIKLALTSSMDATIEGFIAFLGQKPDSTVNASFERANNQMQAFQEGLGRLVATPGQ